MQSIEEVHARLIKLGEEWADLNAAADLLETMRKSILAKLSLGCFAAAKSAAKAEMIAESDEEYIEHVTKQIEARRKANIAQVRYKSAQVWIDLLRSQESTRRAELNLGK